MTSLLLAPVLEPGAIAWLTAVAAAIGGVILHVAFPPRDPEVAEALLLASVHP